MSKKFLIPDESTTYAKAIWLALGKKMEEDKRVLVYGLGVDDPKAMYQTLSEFPLLFGPNRCFDTPLSEDSLTGYGIGLAISGFKPIHVHQRTDFLLLCCNQLINIAAKIKYLSVSKKTLSLALYDAAENIPPKKYKSLIKCFKKIEKSLKK